MKRKIYMMQPCKSTSIEGLTLLRRGKVRDVYEAGEGLLIVATDRISAYDVIMEEPVPTKGALLTGIAALWFRSCKHIVANHLISTDIADFPPEVAPYRDILEGRTMYVRKAKPLAIECVVRGFLAGSAWREYKATGAACGFALPDGLQEASKLEFPLFTPATKAEEGHDENITFAQAESIVGKDIAAEVRRISLELYHFGCSIAARAGLILADTKFEFGIADDGTLLLIDEILTPDSSRFWSAENYAPGKSQENFDKQALRDYLDTLTWNKQYPPPPIPQAVIESTRAKYQQAYDKLSAILGNPPH